MCTFLFSTFRTFLFYHFQGERWREEGAQQEKIAIAKEMLSEGISIEKIAKITKLSAEEIKKLIH
ncbi:helix-turn-helix domain-containing protein [Thermoanaerobacterium sp. RBIITD]|uniref:helix-turn-helix domain-containing protein n=1 Tax=Thermoanaerobacterium sp. RBIITD TaxID=1550240 RepID=UPI0033142C41